MKRRGIAVSSAVVAVAAALILAGCSGGEKTASPSASATAPANTATSAVMYSSNNATTVGVVVKAAAAVSPSLKVEAVTGSSGPLLQRIKSEAGKNSADVFYSAPADVLGAYADMIEPYKSSEESAIPKDILDPKDRWIPTNTHIVALMVNIDQIPGGAAPAKWSDLTDAKWKGKIIVADPQQSTTALTALYGAYKVLGKDGFQKLSANLKVAANSGDVYPGVANGEYAVGIGYESNIAPYIAGGQAGVKIVYPKDGTFQEQDRAILIKGSAHLDGGKRVIDTILAKKTQEQLLVQAFRRPVRSDIDVSKLVEFLPKLSSLKLVDIHSASDDKGREDFLTLWKTR
ncbi:extracellular solute-binding protein [Microbacterium sp. ASV81]|uniref:Extracellular solute-binding protein n=1 Tax=Microbacterium capsulatum TaxID=3041921 RepID=A0ABU0XDR0_9MICO|nr:extracellular solute-binding protein [Microbacterium sp. ASV81]MDQ4213236.1 extracellular solute-binding protein [Microbacterium sp. ASV81]